MHLTPHTPYTTPISVQRQAVPDHPAPEEDLRDCVVTYPATGAPNDVLMVYLDHTGAPVSSVHCPRSWIRTDSEAKFLDECRRNEEQRIRLVR